MTIRCPLCGRGEPIKILHLRLGSDFQCELDPFDLRRHAITYHATPGDGGEPLPHDLAA